MPLKIVKVETDRESHKFYR